MFDPTLPETGDNVKSDVLRMQFNGLKDLIDAVPVIDNAVVDAINTLPPGDPASVSITVTGSTLHFNFDLPQGSPGMDGSNGTDGAEGPQGPQGEPGMPGEVTFQQLNDALADTSHNCVTVDMLEMSVSDPPTQSEVQLIADKLDQLINTLQR